MIKGLRKNLVVDASNRPVAVQIDYADWLVLESQLENLARRGKAVDLSRHAGVLSLSYDPMQHQIGMREEWS
ncbi:MAG: hypothetical protein HY706_15435 [Candidatus Hydrogenedentes bacterium]|nr:hypothetical protein [Candidatus Hydrogenedentota bacterium]